VNKKDNRIHGVRYVLGLLLVMSLLLLLPSAASAEVQMDADINVGFNTWDLNDFEVNPDNVAINTNEQEQISFEVTAPHKIHITGEIGLTGVVDSVYVNSLNIYMEHKDSSGNWAAYEGRDGNDVVIELVNEQTLYTEPFEIDAMIDVSSYDTYESGDDFRWKIELDGEEQDSTPVVSPVYQDITSWAGY